MTESVASRPRFTADESIGILKAQFDFDAAEIKPLPSERDQNFLAIGGNQRRVLKIANAAADQEILKLQNDLLVFLQSTNGSTGNSFRFPQIHADVNGHFLSSVFSGKDSFAARLLEYVPGRPWAKTQPRDQLLQQLGLCLGRFTARLKDFQHTAADREIPWDLARGIDIVQQNLHLITDAELSKQIKNVIEVYDQVVASVISELRRSIIHNDANDYNLLVEFKADETARLSLIDFGDVVFSHTINELAICLAYVMLDTRDPIASAAKVVGGFHAEFPLTEIELQVLFPLTCLRLCVSLCMSAQQSQISHDPYLSITETPARQLLERLGNLNHRLVEFEFRAACGLTPFPGEKSLVNFLTNHQPDFQALFAEPIDPTSSKVIDLSVGGSPYDVAVDRTGMTDVERQIFAELQRGNLKFAIGRYNEPRVCYLGDQFDVEKFSLRHRSVHLGLDVFAPDGTEIKCPVDATVHSFQDNDLMFDYGPTIILEHQTGQQPFFTLYGHLSRDSIENLQAGEIIESGQVFARIGSIDENGGWPAHLHFQIIGEMLDKSGDFPGVADPDRREIWLSLCPDPNLILGLETEVVNLKNHEWMTSEIISARRERLSPSLSLSYSTPLNIARGIGQFLFDNEGRRYLDMVNNVCHVGHCNQRVAQAIALQTKTLNTNTRYLHPNVVEYSQRLVATLPEHLQVCFFVNSGSESNDLALRLARNFTNREDVICLDSAYHGHVTSLIEISPYKFDSVGGPGCPNTTHVADKPDVFRGRYRVTGDAANQRQLEAEIADCSREYVFGFQDLLLRLAAERTLPAAFIAESLLSCGGQIVPPPGYLRQVFELARTAGAVTIADEVQVGFGRVGESFWGFQLHDALPDIVTMGKPIANGHPVGAVITTREIADAFCNGMEYFNTYGGNPVSCAAGLAVLDEIKKSGLQQKSLELGQFLSTELKQIQNSNPLIGDIRGCGLFIGIELVVPQTVRQPNRRAAKFVVEQMLKHQILLSTDGPDENVIKIKPPLVVTSDDLKFFLHCFAKSIEEAALLQSNFD